MASVYPDATDSFRTVENLPNIAYNAADKTTDYAEDTNNLADAVVAVETTLGINPEGGDADVAARLAAIEASIAAIPDRQIAVGGLYLSTSSTNPATPLGYGTWAAYAAGRVLVGKDSSGTFATGGATGGAETHTLTTAELASHTHTMDTSFSFTVNDGASQLDPAAVRVGANINRYSAQVQGGGIATGSAGSGTAHNILQPYIVVYCWERTA